MTVMLGISHNASIGKWAPDDQAIMSLHTWVYIDV